MSDKGTSPPLHPMVEHLSWLLGKWRSEKGQAFYPTMKDMLYGEEVEFFHVGQPNLQFTSYSWTLDEKKPLHREVGFIRVKPGTNQVGLMIAQNLGVVELEEGEVTDQVMKTESHTLGRLSFGKDPATKKVSRVFRRDGDDLEHLLSMETANTTMQEHLKIKYVKVDKCLL